MHCQAKKGFFVLRDCKAKAVQKCQACSRPMCSDHIAAVNSKTICHECFGKQFQKNLVTELDEHKYELSDSHWTSAYRHQYYKKEHNSPIYFGEYMTNYYNGYDIRAFEQELMQLMDVENEDAPHLLDS